MTTRRKHIWIFILCALALAVLIGFKPAYGWRLRAWLDPQNIGQDDPSNPSVTAENETLKAQLAVLENISAQLPQNSQDQIRAMIYSQYPFGFKNEIMTNAGTSAGVTTGNPATFEGIFIGTIQKAYADSSVIQTVFDPSFKMPVRIGTKGVDALLIGGALPKATSIAKNATISAGDIVYAAAPGFPYGMPIGTVAATNISSDNLFQEASLNFSYDINAIQTILIARAH